MLMRKVAFLLCILSSTYAIQCYCSPRRSALLVRSGCRQCRNVLMCSSTGKSLTQHDKPSSKALRFVQTIWDFSRPHTVVGSAFSAVAIFMFASPPTYWMSWRFWKQLGQTLVPALFMNLYITGLNQLTDIDIDRINKPYLPIAAGNLKESHGVVVILSSLVASLLLARTASWPMKTTLLGSCLLGSLYSLPPVRLKRFPLLAAISIFVVRGALVNLGFFLEAKLRVVAEIGILSQGFFSTCAQYPECLALATFFSLFGLVIAVMKDVPDVLGDTRYSIPSYTVKFGARRAFDFSRNLLVSLLGTSGAVITSFAVMALRETGNSLVVISRSLVGFALIAMAVSARRRARLVNPEDSKAVFANYMFTWNFFYGCYALLPLLALS